MYNSFILILVLMTTLSSSGAYSGRFTGDHRISKYDMPLYEGSEDEVVNIGNGVNRKNFVILDQGPDNMGAPYQNTRSKSQPDPLGNKFGDDPTRNFEQPYLEPKRGENSWHGSSTTNIGNGYNNRNTVVVGNNGRRSGTLDPSDHGWNNGGTSYVHENNNGLDVFNVGYGRGNQNKVTDVDGRPIQPDCHGRSCDDVKIGYNGAAKLNPAFSVFLRFLSTFYLILI